MSYNPNNPNGQAAMANSSPVVIASNQSAVPVSASSLPLPTGAATETTLGGVLTQSDFDTKAGSLTEAAPATDTASSGLNGRLQRIAQRLTSLIALLPSSLGANGGLKIEGVASGTAVPVSGTVTANIGTSGSLALDATLTGGTQQSKITDGTNVATVKAASTAAGATDKALVVAISPNNTVPVSLATNTPTLQAGSTTTVTQATGTNLHTVVDSGTISTITNVVHVDDNAGSLTVDYATTGSGTASGALRVELPTNGTGVVGLNAGSNIIGKVGIDQTTPGTTNLVALSAETTKVIGTVRTLGNVGATLDATLAAGTAPANGLAVIGQYNTTLPAPTNGQTVGLQLDRGGNLKINPGTLAYNVTVAAAGTVAAGTTAVLLDNVTDAGLLLVHLTQTSTITAGAVKFQITYDDTTWLDMSAQQVLDPTSATLAQIATPYTLAASTNKPFLLMVAGARQVRSNISTQKTGTGTVTANVTPLPIDSLETFMGAQPTKIMDAAGNGRGANVDASGNLQVTLASTGANATAVKVDNSAVTQPVSYATTGSGTATGALRVELPTNGTGVVGLNTGTNSIGKISDITTSVVPGTGATNLGKAEDAAHTTGDTGVMMLAVRTDTPATTSSNTGDYDALHTNATGALQASLYPDTVGGLSYSWNSIKATATSVKASAGQVYGWYIYNSNSSAVYVQFFNTASGSVTLGTTVPVYSLGIPATSGANVMVPMGIAHSTAITIAATTTATGNTAPTNNVDINIFYK